MTEWLLMKRGLFYRPDDCGYTGIRAEAGRYSEEKATARSAGADGIKMIHFEDAPEFAPSCYWDFKQEHLQKQRDMLRAAVLQIDAINDNPARFNPEINAICDAILRPHLAAPPRS